MTHIPIGYRVVNGKAEIDEAGAEMVRIVFGEYLKGATLTECARLAGFERKHSSVKRILINEKYLGDGFYPQIIDRDTFEKAEQERSARAVKLGRIRDNTKQEKQEKKRYSFSLGEAEQKYSDPFRQAEYVYSRIETEEINDQNSNNDPGNEKGGKHSS